MARIHRRRFLKSSAALGAALAAAPALRAQGANEQLNLGIIGTGWRGGELLKQFSNLPDVRVVALCDTDSQVLDVAAKDRPDVKRYSDLRKLLDDKDIDIVAVATCNHWHALAAIWAIQAGKDVYVEKPLTHNHWEGQQLVNAARKHDRIVQIGTQQRSDPLQAELKDYFHKDKSLGNIDFVQVCRFGRRASIGKRATPLKPPASLDYNLWCGPANDQPVYRDKWHYDWHWDWNTGNGEQGNWGVHVLDDAVNTVLLDKAPFPKRILAAGGRVLWNDAGQSPNVSVVFYDSGSIPVLFGLTNLPNKKDGNADLKYKGVGSGYVVHCENGYYAGGRGGGAAFDRDGKEIRKFRGDAGAKHPRNFVDAVKAHDRKLLNAEVQIGHQSTAWCNMANIASQVGGPYSRKAAEGIGQDVAAWGKLIDLFEGHLAKNGVDIARSEIQVSPLLEFDTAREQFVGPEAATANRLLRREYHRPQFEVPAIG